MPEDVLAGMSERLVLKEIRKICTECEMVNEINKVTINGFTPSKFDESSTSLVIYYKDDVILSATTVYLYENRNTARESYGRFVAAQHIEDWKTTKEGNCLVQGVENRVYSICLMEKNGGFAVGMMNGIRGFRP
jgi:hypothetical protein